MGIKKVNWLVATVVLVTFGMKINVQAQGRAVVDISEWQGRLSPSQVRAMKSQVLFVINRRQYGLNYIDRDAVNNTALYVRYGIPFGEYDFSQFTDASSARREAQAFYARSNKAARFYALDFEVDTVRSGSTNAAVAAWYHEMRSLTNKKLIFYSYASFALTYANQARQRFDTQWIGSLTRRPPIIPAALWQYTDRYHLTGLAAPVDNSRVMTSIHPVSWWLGTTRSVPVVATKLKTMLPVSKVYRLKTGVPSKSVATTKVVIKHVDRPKSHLRIQSVVKSKAPTKTAIRYLAQPKSQSKVQTIVKSKQATKAIKRPVLTASRLKSQPIQHTKVVIHRGKTVKRQVRHPRQKIKKAVGAKRLVRSSKRVKHREIRHQRSSVKQKSGHYQQHHTHQGRTNRKHLVVGKTAHQRVRRVNHRLSRT
ncbi:GH25 family lysozyme [Lactiplantibacillus sp. DA1]|uniref:GH25 family lysozyme n=1 Tax=Lactiplantibacillus sp. DA1 TaxID=3079857 RepID=UPI00292A6646|nr:GH25 family lysozyme [Lactiplantibacillus sp. DA1]MDV0430251.1 GH25 family lysozyme [Lactiplantibacillus sp. DA1]